MKNRVVIACIFAMVAGWAQSPPVASQSAPGSQTASSPAIVEIAASNDAKTTFSTRVNLVVVPVVVRDRKSRAIGTLTKEDFQLFDKGKLQTITRFSVEKAGEKAASEAQLEATAAANGADSSSGGSPNGPTVIPTRFIAYLFDDLHIAAGDLMQIRTAAIKHFSETLQPTDRVAIYTTSGVGMLDFTDDLVKMKEALDRIQPRVAADRSLDCPPVTAYQADLILNYHDGSALSAAATDAFACGQLLNISILPPGQAKILAENMAQASASHVLAENDQSSQQTLSVLSDLVRRMSVSPGQRSIVLLSPGFLVTTNYRYEESDVLDRAIRANVIINALDARGLYTFETGADGGGGAAQITGAAGAAQAAGVLVLAPPDVSRARFQRESAQADENVLAEVAEGTGGTFFHNNNDYGEGLRSTAAAPEFIYLLGFSPQNLKYDGSFHGVRVTLKPKDLNMQARRGYYAPKHAVSGEEQATQEIREAIFSREEVQEFGVALQTQFFKPTADTARLSVLTHIDIKNLRFQKADGVNNDNLTVVAGLFDRNGNMLSAIKKVVFMKLPEDTLAVRMGTGVAVKTNFDVQPGKYMLRVVVRDSEGEMMSARNGIVDIP